MHSESHVVIGANGGIGSELCRRLRGRGCQVTLAGRDEEELRSLATDLDSAYQLVDATSIESVERCLATASKEFGPLSGVVNCAGSVLLKAAHMTTPQEWAETIAVNLTSAFATVRAAYQVMREQGGSIILMSSASAETGLPNHEAIAAAKAGVIGLMRSAAASYAARRIRVNAVAPGLVRTGLTRRIWSNARAAEHSRGLHAMGRLGEASDVASLINWLLTEENDWMTGQVIAVDGGLSTLRAPARSG